MTMTLEAKGRHSMSAELNSHKGFTLIELMISLAAASIVTAGIYGFYHVQQKSHAAQQLVVEMQQNIRATMSLMKREIRMVGYDPAAADGIDNDGINGIDDPAESSGSILNRRILVPGSVGESTPNAQVKSAPLPLE